MHQKLGILLVGIALHSSGCQPEAGPSLNSGLGASQNAVPDPFGFGIKISQAPKKDLSLLIRNCQQTTKHQNTSNHFKSKCLIESQGIILNFDRYEVDSNDRIVAISGVHAEQALINQLRGQHGLGHGITQSHEMYCIRFGKITLPELTISTKDKCEDLIYGLL